MRKNKKSFLIKEEAPKKFNTLNIISAMMLIGLLALFITSIGYAIKDLVVETQKSAFVLPLIQRITTTILILIPFIVKRIFRIQFPVLAVISFYLFIFLSVYIGEFTNLYEFTSLYNKFVHGFSGILLGFLSMFFLRPLIQKREKNISIIFVFIFVFIFSVALSTCWEVWEFIIDSIFNSNMQAHQNLIGREVLFDTMFDIIANVVGAIISAIICSIYSYKNKEFIDKFKVTIIEKQEQENSQIEEIEE